MEIKFFESLSKNYLELLNDKDDYNVIINVGESPDTKIFQAHSTILKYRSSYFRNELNKINKDSDNIKTINLKHVSIQQFEIIIKYIYGGVISLDNLDSSFIFELMIMANNFLLEELAKYFENHLIETKASWLRLRFAHVYKASIQNNNLQDLHNWCNNIVAKYPDKVFDTEDFISLPESALVSLIRRDDLQMDEGKIWKYIITWGIAQNPSLPSNSEDWSNENFQTLRTTLINCLPLIRYFQISNDDIIDNVQPYQRILEKTLWNDILKRLANSDRQITSIILPPRKILIQSLPIRTTELFSKVISETHAAEIASWIDKETDIYSIINNPYKYKLILRGSRDGFTPEAFWNLCNNQKDTVVVIKVKDTDEILGGYNPIEWKKPSSSQWVSCNESFIFSLKNGIVKNSILSRVQNSEFAFCYYDGFGPYFGGGCDLGLFGTDFQGDTYSYCFRHSYEIPIRNDELGFSVEEYEVFQIYKKV